MINRLVAFCIILISLPFEGNSQQSSQFDQISSNILKNLESSDAIRNLYVNRNLIDNQLRDINNWAGNINANNFSQLKAGYEETRSHLNDFTKHLCDDLRSFKRIKDLKGDKLKEFGNHALTLYQADLSAANTAYTSKFKPLYEQIAINKGSKPKIAFAVLLPIIIQAAPALFDLVSNLIRGNSQGATDNVFQLAITGVSATLETKLNLPSWESKVTNTPGISATATGQAQTLASDMPVNVDTRRVYNSVDATIALKTVSGGNLNLKVNSTDVSGKSFQWFETVDKLPDGFIYQVELSGYNYVNVLAYSYTNGAWEWLEPKRMKDIRTVTIDLNGGTKKLPAFQIENSDKGDNREEDFLIVLSNQPIDASRLDAVLTSPSGTAILNTVNSAFGDKSTQSPTTGLSVGQAIPTLSLYQVTDGSQVVLPVYIKLNRR